MAVENDVVLIYYEDEPAGFARIEEILPDVKPGWYHVRILLLQIPLQTVTWILRDAYIDGDEFTMNGKRIRLEMVKSPEPVPETDETVDDQSTNPEPREAKVISLADMKKK
ncbi:MAG: hypothetical protein HKM93_14260 [Desulfobacteraceae bacterium]|nr:hypothetical protein [Desulfobacteraceae bacterium]